MIIAKQVRFCGAVARALLIGVDKTATGQRCPKVNAGFRPGEGRKSNPPSLNLSQYLRILNERYSFAYFWKLHPKKFF